MDIKGSITSKIIASYILVIVSSLIIVGCVFSLLAKFYSEKQAKDQLVKDANAVFDIIAERNTTGAAPDETAQLALKKKINDIVGEIGSNFVLISRDKRILYPKQDEAAQFKAQVLPKIEKRLNVKNKKAVVMRIQVNGAENLLVILPPRADAPAGMKGWIVLYSPVGPVQKLLKSLVFVLVVSLLIAAVIAAGAGIFIARSIARPIILLKKRAESLSKLEFEGTVDIRTGDELEELGKTVNSMAEGLKEYDQAQKRFFQNASHELKTPLMSIQGYAEGIKDGVFEDNGEALDVIIEESKRLKGIVESLIFLSKSESREDFYKFSEESLNDMVQGSILKVKGLAAAENIEIGLSLCCDVRLAADREKITEALINILGNCLRYAKSRIDVITEHRDGILEITIRDDGEGLDEGDTARIFERFYKGKKGETGLGLAITRAIIQKHGGTINACNSIKGGAEFIIRLPL